MEITNPKIGFKHFPGFSLLFDNPGENSFFPLGSGGHFLKVNCPVGNDPSLKLYAGLQAGLEEIDRQENLRTKYLFFDLPSYSYHVTVWDGLNEENKGKVFSNYQLAIEDFLLGLPHSLLQSYPFTTIPKSSSLCQTSREITFQFDRLSVFGESALVAQLKPSEENSVNAHKEIATERVELYEQFKKELGLGDWTSFQPHVSLGYFGNKQTGKEFKSRQDHWTGRLKKKLVSLTITFQSISLYGFADMETFFKVK